MFLFPKWRAFECCNWEAEISQSRSNFLSSKHVHCPLKTWLIHSHINYCLAQEAAVPFTIHQYLCILWKKRKYSTKNDKQEHLFLIYSFVGWKDSSLAIASYSLLLNEPVFKLVYNSKTPQSERSRSMFGIKKKINSVIIFRLQVISVGPGSFSYQLVCWMRA